MWFLIIILWQAGAPSEPSANIAAMKDKAACVKALTTWDTGETALNDDGPSWLHDKWSASCEFRSGEPRLRT